MKKITKLFLAILALSVLLGIVLSINPNKVNAASSVVESDWLSAPPKTLVKCPGGDCDHTECDYVYSFAVVGDTQNINYMDAKAYAKAFAEDSTLTYETYTDAYMKTLYNWILANKDAKNIQYVMGLGDITQSFSTSQANYANEWALAHSAISLLDGKLGYSLVRGNHDISSGLNGYFGQGTIYYNDLVALSLEKDSEGRPMAGLFDESKIEDSYRKVIIGEDKYIIFTLEYYPTEEGVAWLNEMLTENSDYKAIITLHTFLTKDNSFNDPNETTTPSEDALRDNWKETATGGNVTPRELWETSLSLHENVSMILSGHVDVDDILVNQMVGKNGNTVTCMLIDGQTIDSDVEPVGLVTMFYVSADGKVINVEHISSIRDAAGENAYLKEKNQFELCIDYEGSWTSTEYGNLPTVKYDANTFHVFLDDDGNANNDSVHLGSFNTWEETLDSVIALNEIGGVNARKNKTYSILMSKDFKYAGSIAPNLIGSNPGKISLDLDDHEMNVSSGVLIPFYNKSNEFAPTFTVKNGDVTMSGSGALAVLQTSIKNTLSTVNLNFENLDITYASSNKNLVGTYPGFEGYDAAVNLKVENCTIDTTLASGAVTIFNLSDTYSNSDISLKIIGGSIKGTTIANTTIASTNADDKVLLDKNSSGNYPELILNEKGTISEIYSDSNGYNLSLTTASTAAPYVYTPEKVDVEVTPYGYIPNSTYPIDEYPFVLFQNGEVVKGYTSWQNFCEKCGGVTTTADKNSVLYLRKDYEDPATKASQNLMKVKYLTVDLGGHTLSSNIQLFYLMYKNNEDFVMNINVKNGTLIQKVANKTMIVFGSSSSATEHVGDFNLTFDRVTIKSASKYSGRLVAEAFDTGTYGSKGLLIFNDCTFDMTEGSIDKLFKFEEANGQNKFDVSAIINGGKVIANKYFTSNIATFSAERESGKGSPDSLTFGKGSDGKDFYVQLPSSVAHPTSGVVTTKGTLYPIEVVDDGTNAQYVYKTITTKYGDIPADYRSEVDYPFIVIQNGSVVGGGATWVAALTVADGKLNTASASATILMRIDAGDSNAAYSNWSTINGTLTVDLNGKTFTASNRVVSANKKNSNDTTVIFTNGNIVLAGSGKIVYFGSTVANGLGNNRAFNITFDGIDFSFASGFTGTKIVDTMQGAASGIYTLGNLVFDNCNFDFVTNAPNKTLVFFDMSVDTNNHALSAVINGGTIKYNPAKFTWFTANDDDSFKFGKYNSAYTILKAASVPTGEFDSVEEGAVVFVATEKANEYTLAVKPSHICAPETHVAAKAPTCVEAGNIEYWICECGEKYLDEACTEKAGDVIIPKNDNHVIDLANTPWTVGDHTHYKTCECDEILVEEKHDGELSCSVCGHKTIGVYKSGDDLYFIEWNGKLLTGKFYVTEETANGHVNAGWYYADNSGKFIDGEIIDDEGTLRYIVGGKAYYNNGGAINYNGKIYFIEWDGRVQTGKFYVTEAMIAASEVELSGSGWYYADDTGAMITSDFVEDGDVLRYVRNGKTYYNYGGAIVLNNNIYFIEWDGRVQTGKFYVTADMLARSEIKLNETSGWFYADKETGAMITDGFFNDNGVKRYIRNGKAYYNYGGAIEIGDKIYVIEWNGQVQTGKFYITESMIAHSEDKELIKAAFKKGSGWYTADETGALIFA